MAELFDNKLRALRRDRAARLGPELFLFDRVFDDCIERIALTNRRFNRALLIGCPDPRWPEHLGQVTAEVEVRDPGSLFAQAASGSVILEDLWDPKPAAFDLVLAIGTLDTVNDLPLALQLIRHAMAPGALFIGAAAGGDTLPQLRAAMRAADVLGAGAAAHVHPRLAAASLAPLLGAAGFVMPVVDIDRVQLSYSSFGKLVADLRRMAATNVLLSRARRLTREQSDAAAEAFHHAGDGQRTPEIVEILHFAAWSPAQP